MMAVICNRNHFSLMVIPILMLALQDLRSRYVGAAMHPDPFEGEQTTFKPLLGKPARCCFGFKVSGYILEMNWI